MNLSKKYIFILIPILLLIGALHFKISQGGNTLLKSYIDLSSQIWDLEKVILANKNFALSKEAINMSEGVTSKYWLLDEKNEQWLFKINPLKIHDLFEEKISQFIRLAGFNTPLLVASDFSVNQKKHQGSLQQVINKKFDLAAIQIRSLEKSNLDYILTQEPITYLFDTEHEYLMGTDNKIYTIDLNDIHFFSEQAPFNADALVELMKINQAIFDGPFPVNFIKAIYQYLIKHHFYNKNFTYWESFYETDNRGNRENKSISLCKAIHNQYIREGTLPPLNEIAKTINFIANLDDTDLLKVLTIPNLKNNFFYNEYINQVLQRKHAIKQHFELLYKAISKDSAVPFKVSLTTQYTKAELDQKINLLKIEKIALEEKKQLNPNKIPQLDLDSISSPEAHYIMFGFTHRLLSKRNTLSLLDKTAKLAKNDSEKQAIADYINIVNTSPLIRAVE